MTQSVHRKWVYALAAGLIMAALTWMAYRLPPATSSDIDQTLAGAEALRKGLDPYVEAGEAKFYYPMLYPVTALLMVSPFTLFSTEVARSLFAGVSGLLFAWAAMSYGRGLPAALLSACFLNAVIQGQWSPLLTAGAASSAFGFLWAAKPSVGLALFLAYPSMRAAIGVVLIGVASLIVEPGWPDRWLEGLPKGIQTIPMLQPGGFVLLLAFMRWRVAEARLLGILACVPQTIGLYEALPLFLIPRSKWEGYGLAISSYVVAFLQASVIPRAPGMPLEELLARRWPLVLICLYVPALMMALRPETFQGPRARGASCG